MSENEILDGLNEDQKEAVAYTDGPLLIIAGPGTGKTLTITRRILYLLHTGIKPHEIIGLTFTNRAALEMKERVKGKGDGVFLGTFHMFGLNILRKYNNSGFRILTREEGIEILKAITGETTKKAYSILHYISRIKNFYEEGSMQDPIFLKYENALKEINAFDIDDLIIKTIELIHTSEEVQKELSCLKHILIDEYQDINPSQYRLIKALYGFTEHICAVGDLDQAIYAFRGADIEHFLDFEKDFKGAKTVFLKNNYRSSRIILEASQALIKNNKNRIEHPLYPASSMDHIKIKMIDVNDEYEEARFIIKEIEKRIGAVSHVRLSQDDFRGNWGDNIYCFSDFAVFVRTNNQLNSIRDAFMEAGIPHQIIHDSFYEEINEIRKRLENYMHNQDPEKTLSSILDEAFSIKGMEALSGLKRNLLMAYGDYPYEVGLIKILQELNLFRPEDILDQNIDVVSLMTLHMSKGLEFYVVFIAGFEDGLIPYILAMDDADIEEERRLFYVGMTRAKKELFLIASNRRSVHGKIKECKKSRFFYEIPEAYMESIKIPKKDKPKKKPKQESLF
ncbi:MAG: ATP-dependent helicase [Syntrophorhabdaceae bacterium]|nr:ATP-dependent helicase [Syntrophorhabdaceae bacterium]